MKLNQHTFKGALLGSTAILSAVLMPQTALAQEQEKNEMQKAILQNVEEIQVVSRFIPQEKRSTSEIASVAKAEDFKRAGDGNVAVALTRLPGISPDSSGKYVVIRGLSERYTSTLLNGTQMPSPDPLKSSVPLDIFPTSMIESVLVQKTYSAEFPGAFGGGVIDIRTKAVPNQAFFKINLKVGYNTESTGKDGLAYYGSDTDWLGMDDGKRDLPQIIADNPTLEGMTPSELEAAGEAIVNVWSIDYQANYPDFDFGVSAGDSYDVGDGELGVILAVDYGSQYRNRFGERYSYSASTATESGLDKDDIFGPEACEDLGVDGSECGYFTTIWNVDLNAFAAIGYNWGKNELKFNSVLLRSSQRQVQILQGRTDSRDLANFVRSDWNERQVWSNSVFGKHYFNLGSDLDTELNWYASKTSASRVVPNRRTFEYFYDEADGILRMSARTDGNQISWGTLEDDAKDFGFTLEQPTYLFDKEIDFKFGATTAKKERVSDFKRYGFDLANVTNRELRERVPEIIFGTVNIDPEGIFLREYIDASDRFDASFDNTSAFGQMDVRISDFVRLSGGVRYEDSQQIVSSVDRITREPITVTQAISKLLPSATLTWTVYEDMQLRFGFSETLNRPDSRELSPARFVREDGRTEEGNPNLQAATIRNFDMRYEWYVGKGESITIGAFYKEITNPIEYSIKPIGDGQLDFIANADLAKIKGIEAEAEIILGEWSDREFFFKVNGSYIDSNVTRTSADFGDITTPIGQLQGQSKYLANMQVGFENIMNGEKVNLIVNYIGERIYRLGTNGRPDLIEKPPLEVNMVYSREIETKSGHLFTLSFNARNLLNEAPQRTQGGLVAERFDVGRSFSFGVNFDF